MNRLLERIVGAASAPSAARAARRRPDRLAGTVLALRLEPSAATDTLVGRGSECLQGDRPLRRALRRPLDRDPRARRSAGHRADAQPATGCSGWRAASPATSRRRSRRSPAGPTGRARASRPRSPCRSSTARARSSTRRSGRSRRSSRRSCRPSSARPRPREAARASVAKGAGTLAGRAEAPRRGRALARLRRVPARPAPARPALQPVAAAAAGRRSTTRTSSRRSCSTRRRCATCPKARFAYLFPNQTLGDHPGAAQAGLSEERRTARSRSCAGGRDAGVGAGPAARTYTVTGAPCSSSATSPPRCRTRCCACSCSACC